MNKSVEKALIVPAAIGAPPKLEGFVDYYGYSAGASGWLMCGWISTGWRAQDITEAVARFENGSVSGHFEAINARRPDLGGRGRALLLLLSAPQEQEYGALVTLELVYSGHTQSIRPTETVQRLEGKQLNAAFRGALARAPLSEQRDRIATLISGAYPGPGRPSRAVAGFIESFAHCELARGWLFRGVVTCGWEDEEGPDAAAIHLKSGDVIGKPLWFFYKPSDAAGDGVGVVIYVPGDASRAGPLVSVELLRESGASQIDGSRAERSDPNQMIGAAAALIGALPRARANRKLANLLNRKPFANADTTAALVDPVDLHLDEAIRCPPDGLCLMGWMLARPGQDLTMTLRGLGRATPIDLGSAVVVSRPDVIEAVGAERGFDDARCGFIVYARCPDGVDGDGYIEIETALGEVAYKPLPPPRLEGMAAIKRIAGSFDFRYDNLARAFEHTIGPAIQNLNRQRLAKPTSFSTLEFGSVNKAPRISIVVPIYGIVDFVEVQLALFSVSPVAATYEFIYVLDDPSKRDEAERLFASVHDRFKIPFRALMLDRNVGYAAANNIGLRSATGQYLCFLNSDVFFGPADWLERLADRLERHVDLGAIGPVLRYDNGSIQHQGMGYKRLPEFGNWLFCDHPGKGRRVRLRKGLRYSDAITGACIFMARNLAQQVGGFSESYLNDFEDADLCLKVREKGLACAVDLDVELFHLERQSHPGSAAAWSRNLVFYNAWLHNRLWAPALDEIMSRDQAESGTVGA